MIKSLRFENFKGFLDLEVPEVAPITIIGGENDVGKTSLLEGIRFFYDLNNPFLFMRHLAWRDITLTSVDPDIIVAPIFYDLDIQKSLKITVDDDAHHVILEIDYNANIEMPPLHVNFAEMDAVLGQIEPDVPPAPSYNFKMSCKIDDQETQSRNLLIERNPVNLTMRFEPAVMQLLPEQMRKGVFYTKAHKMVGSEDVSRFMELSSERDMSYVTEFLQIVEPKLTGLRAFRVKKDKALLYVDIGMKRDIPIGLAGDAINRLFLMVVTIATAKDSVVLIDEIDTGIHYSHMDSVWTQLIKAARENNCQIIATTHNYECLIAMYNAAAHADMIEQFRYVRLDKRDRSRNRTVAKTYPHDILESALQDRWEVR